LSRDTVQHENHVSRKRTFQEGTLLCAAYTRPFVVTVMTDPDEGPLGSATDKSNRGFNLIWSQQPCIAG
jgi:hypothetical protein